MLFQDRKMEEAFKNQAPCSIGSHNNNTNKVTVLELTQMDLVCVTN